MVVLTAGSSFRYLEEYKRRKIRQRHELQEYVLQSLSCSGFIQAKVTRLEKNFTLIIRHKQDPIKPLFLDLFILCLALYDPNHP
jgi:hypothetical protein